MQQAFRYCSSLKTVDLSNTNAPVLQDIGAAFADCVSLTEVNLNNFNAPAIETTRGGNVPDGLFYNCKSLASLDLSGLNFKFVEDFSGMFKNCTSLTDIKMPAQPANAAKYTYDMFENCTSLTQLDLSWIQSSVLESTGGNSTFRNCPKLKTVTVGDITSWKNILPSDVRDEANDVTYERVMLADSQGNQFTSSSVPVGANTYTISRTYSYPIDNCSIDIVGSDRWLTYTGQPLRPKFSVSIEYNNYIPDQILKEGVDYTVEYRNNTDPGEATAIIKGKGKWVGERTEYFQIEDYNGIYDDLEDNNNIAISKRFIPATSILTKRSPYAYTGKSIKPAITVKDGGKTLREGIDYTVSYRNNKNVGTAKVTVTGKGAYTGTKTATFKIVPKGTSVKKLSKAKRAFTVKWKKPSKAHLKQTTGYQVRWSTSKKFTKKTTKTMTVKATSAAGKKCTLKVSKLKAKKTYYVQVRTYKKVGGKTYYSSWSKAKAVKTKR